jgi:hypothetical protein
LMEICITALGTQKWLTTDKATRKVKDLPNKGKLSAIILSILITFKGRFRPYYHPTSLTSSTSIVTLVVASSILPPVFESLKTLSQRRVCLQFKSELLDRPQLVVALSILPSLIKSLETLRQRRVCMQFKSESLDRPQLALPRVYSLQAKLWKNRKSNFLRQ